MEVDLPPNPTNPLPTSDPIQRRAAELLLGKLGKLKVADQARLMADNQRTLNTTLAADRAHRDLSQRVQEWQFERAKGSLQGNGMATQPDGVGVDFGKDDDMGINIDSPTTVNYHFPKEPAPTPAAAGTSTLAKVAQGASWLVGGVGLSAIVGAVLGLLNRPAEPAPTPQPVPYIVPQPAPQPATVPQAPAQQPTVRYQPGGVRLEVVPYQPR